MVFLVGRDYQVKLEHLLAPVMEVQSMVLDLSMEAQDLSMEGRDLSMEARGPSTEALDLSTAPQVRCMAALDLCTAGQFMVQVCVLNVNTNVC